MPAKKELSETITKKRVTKSTKNRSNVSFWKTVAFVLLGVFIFSQLFTIGVKPKFNFLDFLFNKSKMSETGTAGYEKVDASNLQSTVIPEEGVELPITWGDFGKRMTSDGVIDEEKFRKIFPNGLDSDSESILAGNFQRQIVMTQQNSQFLLDMLWAFGLANKNEILTEGEMIQTEYGGDASKFASTGGWSLSRGNVMNHYSAHPYVALTSQQQDLVDRVSSGIYRPCCGNSTHFPDCNHGMAMLGLLELMAASNVSEEKMYEVALKVNSYWFPQTYLDLATYFAEQGQAWENIDPKLVLGSQYSSAQGYIATRQKIKSLPTPASGGGSCGA